MPKTPIDDTTPVPEVLVPEPVARDAPREGPTLDQAFYTLGYALFARLEDDLPTSAHVEETIGIFTDGNTQVAWQRLVGVLEGVLGIPLVPR